MFAEVVPNLRVGHLRCNRAIHQSRSEFLDEQEQPLSALGIGGVQILGNRLPDTRCDDGRIIHVHVQGLDQILEGLGRIGLCSSRRVTPMP